MDDIDFTTKKRTYQNLSDADLLLEKKKLKQYVLKLKEKLKN